jgi:hypothetical protein
MVAVPDATPVTIPEAEPTVATVVVLLAHAPPPASVSDVVRPTHTLAVPVIEDGSGLIVATSDVRHPVPNV